MYITNVTLQQGDSPLKIWFRKHWLTLKSSLLGSKSDVVSVVKNFDESNKFPDPKIVERSGLKSIIMSLIEVLSDKCFCTNEIIFFHYLNHPEYWIFQLKLKIEWIGLRRCLINHIIFFEKLYNYFEHILTQNSKVKSSPPPTYSWALNFGFFKSFTPLIKLSAFKG